MRPVGLSSPRIPLTGPWRPAADFAGPVDGLGPSVEVAPALMPSRLPGMAAALSPLPPAVASQRTPALEAALAAAPDSRAAVPRAPEPGAVVPLAPEVEEAMARLESAPLAEGIDRDALLREARAAVADPGAAISQGTHPHTCVATTLEYRLAREAPTRFLGLLEGLVSPSGEVAGGWARPSGCLQDDGTGRSLVDRVVQGTLFARAGAPMHYDAATHRWEGPAGGPAQGLQPRQARALLEELTGDISWQTVSGHEARGRVASILQRAMGEGVALPVALFTLGGDGHEVLVEEFDGSRVVYRDPEGPRALPFEGAEAVDPARGRFVLALEDFEDQLASLAAPARLLPAELLSPDAWMF